MTTLCQRVLEEPRASRSLLSVLRLVGVLLLAGWLLVAHGCHGDEDNELWVRVQVWLLEGK